MNNRIKSLRYVFAIVTMLLIVLISFKGSFQYGLHFDNVFRHNNLIPLINSEAQPFINQSIYSLKLFNIDIPLMYKQYISSAINLPYLPLALFNNYLFGFRLLDMLYFFLTLSGLFLILAKYNFNFALAVSFLVLTSPILYPEALFGFVHTWNMLLIPLALHLYYIYFKNSQKSLPLFLGTFILFLGVNMQFYGIWVVTALFLSSLCFFFPYWKDSLQDWKRVTVVLTGAFLGLFNFLLYNVNTGFNTFRTLLNRIFFPNEYNKNPIDYRQAASLQDEISAKVHLILQLLGKYNYFYLIMICLMVAIYLVSLVVIFKQKRFLQYKNYYFPFVVLLLIFSFILVSPNATRAEHYSYLSPYLEISFVTSLVLLYKLFESYNIKLSAVFILPIIFILVNGLSLSNEVALANETKGTGYFSPAVFDLNSYLDKNRIDTGKVVHLEWGMFAQLYFINKGEVKTNYIAWSLIATKNKADKIHVLEDYFLSQPLGKKSKLYFPIYNNEDNLTKGIRAAFFDFIKQHNGKLTLVKNFSEKDGTLLFGLYRLENNKEFFNNLKADVSSRK